MEGIRRAASGQIIAASVLWDAYLREYAADHAEWVDGTVVRLSPVTLAHTQLFLYLSNLLSSYLALTGEGQLLVEPLVMRLPGISAREPDLQVVQTANAGRVRETYVDGPADLVIEIVSPESDTRDHVEKFAEYERGGVGEYWILDPLHQEALFYRRADRLFIRALQPENGEYICAVLPRLRVQVNHLWRTPLPTPIEIHHAVAAMLDSAS